MPKKKRIIFQGDRAAKGSPVKHKIRARSKHFWLKYLNENRSVLADEFTEAARILRERDTDAFLERTRSARRTRAEAAAAKLVEAD